MQTQPRHFLDLADFDGPALRAILRLGDSFRPGGARAHEQPLTGKTLICLFEKPSTRTRVSFEAGMQQLGGRVITLNSGDTQLGRGETIADTARVLSRYADAIMIRTNAHEKLLELARYASIPVINGLTDFSHPCQIMADVMTFEQHRGDIQGRTVAWCGDGNNVATSWAHAAVRFGFRLRVATPPQLALPPAVTSWARAARPDALDIVPTAAEAAAGADCVVTDTWVSMGQEGHADRMALLKPFQVNEAVMAQAADNALFMHCLPAHRGEEAAAGVMDGPQSVIWDEAENRLHAQKGILAWCLNGALNSA